MIRTTGLSRPRGAGFPAREPVRGACSAARQPIGHHGLGAVALLTALIPCAGLLPGSACAAERFEVAAWVDHFDFAYIPRDGGFVFDTETFEGNSKILDHVQEVGATTILWRNCAGSTMRYQSKVESHHQDAPLDKRRVPDSRPGWGWMRYGDAEPDILRSAMDMCEDRGLRRGVHWPFEETHWAIWTIGEWNMEHPQYWGRSYDGQPWWGRASVAFEEVMQHKLALVDELIDRGIETLYIDTWRTGGWSPAYEYVKPVIESYRDKHGEAPPASPNDPRWTAHVGSYVTEFLRRVRERLDASGRKIDLMVGVQDAAPLEPALPRSRGFDWETWVDQGIIDTLVIINVRWDAKDPFHSTRALYREVLDRVGGRCRVLCPVEAYDFSNLGMPAYEKATGLTQDAVATKLMQIAWEEGAAGVSLECVDYNNYTPATRAAMSRLADGPCKYVRER